MATVAETPAPTGRQPEGARILDDICGTFQRFVTWPSDAALWTSVLWATHTWVTDADGRLLFDTTPRLAILGDAPNCGKSTALLMIGMMCQRDNFLIDPTAPGFAEDIHEHRSTELIDEINVLFGGGRGKAQLRSLLCGGYKRRTGHWARAGNKRHIIFGPVAMAGQGTKFRASEDLADIRSRSIAFDMLPAPGKQEAFREREHSALCAAQRRALAKWVGRHAGEIMDEWPELPDGIEGRLREIWEPLAMIASAAGGHWPERFTKACKELALGLRDDDDPSALPLSDLLLIDLRTLFERHGWERGAPRNVIAGELLKLPRWSATWPRPEEAPRELTSLLGIPAEQVWWPDGNGGPNKRGWKPSTLERLWADLPELPEERDLFADWEEEVSAAPAPRDPASTADQLAAGRTALERLGMREEEE
jgi:hypothetical protein